MKKFWDRYQYILFICILLFFYLQCFYLVSSSARTYDISIILAALFTGYVYITCRDTKAHYRYQWLLLFSIIFVITSSVMANRSYNQPLMMGIRAQRHWIVAMLLYFPLTKLLQSGKMKAMDLLKALDLFVLVYSGIVIVQFIVGSDNMFLHVIYNIRYETFRLYVDLSIVRIVYFWHFKLFLDENTDAVTMIRSFIFIGIGLFLEVVVCKSRMAVLALGAATLVMFILQKSSVKKKVLIALFASVTICGFFQTDFGKSTANEIIEVIQGEGSNVAIRKTAQEYYLSDLSQDVYTLFMGCGYVNTDWEQSVTGSHYDEHVGYNDNGILGLTFYYGLIFVVWTMALHFILMRDAWKASRSWMFFYLLCGLLGIYTLFPYSYVTEPSFALICMLIEGGWNATVVLEQKRNEYHQES